MAVLAEGAPAGLGVVVRVAGLTVRALESLRGKGAVTRVRELIEVRRWLATEGQCFSDVLYEVIGGLVDRTAKPFLVALRRTMFTGRRPGNRAWSAELKRLVSGEVAARARAWIMRLEPCRSGWADLAQRGRIQRMADPARRPDRDPPARARGHSADTAQSPRREHLAAWENPPD